MDSQFDPFVDPYLADPYPEFSRYRSEAPVFHSAELGYWVVSGYEAIKAIFKDPTTYSALNVLAPVHPFSDEAARILRDGQYGALAIMSNRDPPDHGRIRKSINLAFTPRRIAALEPEIRRLVNLRIDALHDRTQADFVSALAYDLPAQVLFRLLGIPDADVPRVKLGSEHRLLLIWGRPSPELQASLAHGLVSFWNYCVELVAARLERPADDLTSELIRVRAGSDANLSLQEIASIVFGLLFAGHETTTAFLTNAVRQLVSRPTLWRTLGQNPAQIPATVEELLRLDTSVIAWRRITTRPVTLSGVDLPAAAPLLLLLGSANHDETKFSCPHQLDPGRDNAKDHLAFGFGIHFCLGAALARLEATVAIEILAARLPSLRLMADRPLEYLPNVSFRGPRSLWVEWDRVGELGRRKQEAGSQP